VSDAKLIGFTQYSYSQRPELLSADYDGTKLIEKEIHLYSSIDVATAFKGPGIKS
jgi:hypothetical protein